MPGMRMNRKVIYLDRSSSLNSVDNTPYKNNMERKTDTIVITTVI
jgi:hypothetical protein